MEKIDYGDINKFLASLGIVIITVSFIVPYLYLKEDYGLIIKSDDMVKLSQSSIDIITTKQVAVLNIQKYIPWVTIFLFVAGVIILVVGISRWFARQAKLDKQLDIEIGKAEFELKTLTKKEVELKVKSEIKTTNDSTSSQVHKYIQIEDAIINRFRGANSKNFAILPNQRLNTKFRSMIEIDILLKSLNSGLQDRIVEIKYFKDISTISNRMQSIIDKFERNMHIYNSTTNSDAVAIFIIVYNGEMPPEQYENSVISKLEPIINRSTIKSYKIKLIPEKDIYNFSPYDLLN